MLQSAGGGSHRPAETPEDKAEAAVGIETDGHFSGRVQLTLQLHRPTEGSNGIMGHLERGREDEGGTTRRKEGGVHFQLNSLSIRMSHCFSSYVYIYIYRYKLGEDAVFTVMFDGEVKCFYSLPAADPCGLKM